MNQQNRIQWALLSLRLGVFIVMGVWTLDKFINPGHAAKIFEKFYSLPGIEHAALYAMGGLQALLVLAFVAGFKKRISYGAILLMHTVSTLSSWKAYLDMNMLFFAAWPMLAACFTLYILRDLDTKYTLDPL